MLTGEKPKLEPKTAAFTLSPFENRTWKRWSAGALAKQISFHCTTIGARHFPRHRIAKIKRNRTTGSKTNCLFSMCNFHGLVAVWKRILLECSKSVSFLLIINSRMVIKIFSNGPLLDNVEKCRKECGDRQSINLMQIWNITPRKLHIAVLFKYL